MKTVKVISSRTVVLPIRDIDTDQIIPGRFLTTTTKEGLGKHLFADWRYRPDGSPNAEFVLNRPEAKGCQILVCGHNLGCGSSREHAPWALVDYGFRAVVSSEIADIFRSNALKNALLPVVVDAATNDWLMSHPGAAVEIDLETTSLRLPNGTSVGFPIDPFARYCLMNGIDELAFLRGKETEILAYEKREQGL